jgi:lysophospholipase L1-like esterase
MRIAVLTVLIGGLLVWRVRRGVQRGANWQTSLAGVGIVVFATELGATLMYPVAPPPAETRERPRPPSADFGIDWVVAPEATQASPNRPWRPASDTRRVLFIGDSFTYGDGVRPEETFASRIGESMASKGVEVLNHGLSGWNLDEALNQYLTTSAVFSPDTVVWVVLLNDLGDPPESNWGDLVRHAPPPGVSRFVDFAALALTRAVVHSRTEAHYHDAWDPSHNPGGAALSQDAFALVQAEVASRGGRLVVVIFPLLHKLREYPYRQTHQRIGDLASRSGAEVVDLLEVFEGRSTSTLWASPHDHHPNATAHQLVAQALEPVLIDDPRGAPAPIADRVNCDTIASIPWPEASRYHPLQSPTSLEAWQDWCSSPGNPDLQMTLIEQWAAQGGIHQRMLWVHAGTAMSKAVYDERSDLTSLKARLDRATGAGR